MELGVLIFVLQAFTLVYSEEPQCSPGFTSDLFIFKVERRHLQAGRNLGKIGFDDCTGRKVFRFHSDNSKFEVNGTLGKLRVKREVVLHQPVTFKVHVWDSAGRKWTTTVRVVHQHGHGHHETAGDGTRRNHHGDGTPGNHHGDGAQRNHHSDGAQRNHHSDGAQRNHPEEPQHHQHHGNNHHHGHQDNHELQPERDHHKTETDAENQTEAGRGQDAPVIYFPKGHAGQKRRKRAWVIPEINAPENDRGPFPKKLVQIRSDQDKEVKVVYSIAGPGADQPPLGIFSLHSDSGIIYITQPLDREKRDRYVLKAYAMVMGSVEAEEPMDVIVKVIDMNDNKPVFTQETFLGEVPEASATGFEVVTVNATDLDEPGNANSIIRYKILKQEPELPSPHMFFMNSVSGTISLNAQGLDREKHPKYTLEVEVADMEGYGLTGNAKVIITVTDSNDNAPKFEKPTFEASVPENKVGALIVKMPVTDGDEPNSPAWAAKFSIVSGDPDGLFAVETGPNKQEGILTTAKGLDFEKTSIHILLVAVENEIPFAFRMPTATATVTVAVLDVNEPPQFNPPEKLVVKREDLAVGSDLVLYTATDPDTARSQKVTYKIIADRAAWLAVNKTTGMITVRNKMDREAHYVKDDKYTAIIGAVDDDDIPATGTGTLVIQLEDVNDNAPTIDERIIKVCNKESEPQLLSVTDKDGSTFAAPFSVSLQGSAPTNWSAKMNGTRTGIILTLIKPIPTGEYTVILRVADNQDLSQDSTIHASVCDCSGAEVVCRDIRTGGFGLPGILGILGAILLLLLLVLLLLMFLRRRKGGKEIPLLQAEDVRDNIYCYDEEGGGEDDQDYDLSVLHRGLDNRPEVFRNDVAPTFMPAPQYRPRPANPEDIGNFIDDNLKAADNDPTAPPYDSLLVFDYEGGGSDAGSLSSLNSDSSGDQDYDCFNEWGPRFKKLADMYGGGEDDDML